MKTEGLVAWVDACVDWYESVFDGIRRGLGVLIVFIQIGVPVLIANSATSTFEKLFLSAMWMLLLHYLKCVDRRLNHREKTGLPVPPCRLTSVNERGIVELNDGCVEIAIVYLSELEAYLSKRNRRKSEIDLYRKE